MNGYSSLKKNNGVRPLCILLVLLLLLEAFSLIMLSSRLIGYSNAEVKQRQYIPLTEESGDTRLTVTKKDDVVTESAAVGHVRGNGVSTLSARAAASALGKISRKLTVQHDFRVEDQEGIIWQTETPVELFKFTYENGEGVATVKGDGKDNAKLIAPGTYNSYTFTLFNSGKCALDYTVTVKAYVDGTDKVIPIRARIVDYEGEYLAGSESEMVPILAVDGTSKSGSLTGGYIADYAVEWEWPFESGGAAEDEYDTFFGDLAVDHDITVTLVITTVAECNVDHSGGEDPSPATGDYAMTGFWTFALVVTLVALIILLSAGRRRKDDEDEDGYEDNDGRSPGGV